MISRPPTAIRVAFEPIYNALNSFSLLSATEQLAGLNVWVVQTAATLTLEQLHTNRLVFEALRDGLVPRCPMPDMPTYLRLLHEWDPIELRNHLLDRLRTRFERRMAAAAEGSAVAPDRARLLSDLQAYLTCVEYVQVDVPFDAALQAEAHILLNDPLALHSLLASHLEMLWQTTFVAEWKRVSNSLRWQVEMFARSLDEEAILEETFHAFTGRKLPLALAARLSDRAEVTLVPSWHMGKHAQIWEDETGARLFFSEPPNYDVAALNAAPVGRSELRARLEALADETRLRILELLVQHDEMYAQQLIDELELSQSSVSRHLKQLVSMGYLYERRGEGANKSYRLSSFYFARTMRALERLGSGEEVRQSAVTQEETRSQELRRFLDRSGKLTLWPPAKQQDKLLILGYLASFFEPGRIYSEKEVNELLLLHSVINDSAALRRGLHEYHFVSRMRDGSQYWLTGTNPAYDDTFPLAD